MSFGCCAKKTCTACSTSPSDLKWYPRPRRTSFRDQKRGHLWMPNPINMADGMTSPPVNLFHGTMGRTRSVLCMLQSHNGRHQNQRSFLRITGLSWFRSVSLYQSFCLYTQNYHGPFHITNFIQIFRFSFEWPLYFSIDVGDCIWTSSVIASYIRVYVWQSRIMLKEAK